jgi:hypothetical protein
MKKIFLIGLACAGMLTLRGQGTLQQTAGSHIKIIGGAYLVLDNMHVVNNGSLQMAPGNGFVRFTGPMNVNLSGSGTTTFDEMLMAKLGPSSTLSLQSNISVVSKVLFSGGLIDLGNSVLNLGTTGIFSLESEFSRAFTTGTGYIQATGTLNAPASADLGKLGAIITSTKNLGLTTIRRGHQVQTNVGAAGNSILRFYDIVPTNNMALKATLRFHYFDAELNSIPEPSLHQYKSNNNINWDFVGADSRDPAANPSWVERMNISKFERWTLAPATAPAITCPANMTVSANMSGCKASVAFVATATGIPAPTIVYRIGTTVITSPFAFPKGTTTVTATASNGVAPDATCTFTVTVVCGPVTQTAPVTDTREAINAPWTVSVRPNPSASSFIISLQGSESHPVSIRVFDVLGRVVEERSNMSANASFTIGHRYRPGVYYVEAVQGGERRRLTLIKRGN